MKNLEQITSLAITPDQLLPYVRSVSGMESEICGSCLLHRYEDHAVLVAYPAVNPLDESACSEALGAILASGQFRHVSVLGAYVPEQAPASAHVTRDAYWALDTSQKSIRPKLANMLRRAARDVHIDKNYGENAWQPEHQALVADFCARKKTGLDEATVYIYKQLGSYLANAPQAALFSARDTQNRLTACAIADFSSFSTAFYMFAFRYDSAPPGTADLLLSAILEEAGQYGLERLNLGLGINSGIEFFKKKWAANIFLPYVETSWQIKSKSWFGRLFGK